MSLHSNFTINVNKCIFYIICIIKFSLCIKSCLLCNLINLHLFPGCWVAWEVDTCLRVGVAAIRWCVEVWASSVMALHPETRPMAMRCIRNRCPGMPPGDEEQSPPATTRAAPLYKHGSSSAILCESHPLYFLIQLFSVILFTPRGTLIYRGENKISHNLVVETYYRTDLSLSLFYN